MKTNKSIDGLTTHDAKKTAAKKVAQKKSTKSSTSTKSTKSTKPTVKSAPKKIEETELKDENLSIEVIEETKTEAPKLKTEEEKIMSREAAIEDFLSPVSAFHLEDDLKNATPITSSEETEKPKKKHKKAKKDKKKPSKVRRILTTLALIFVLALIGVVSWAVLWGNDIIAKITGGQGSVLDLFTFTEESYDPLKTDANGRTNILAFGTSGYNMDGDEGNGVHDGAQLTDSIMAISLNQETGDIAMISLPRDLKASPTCTSTGKINEVYWCSNQSGTDENAGATALMTEVGGILGIDFQYYAHLNWGSLVSIVDILGGIKVTLDEDIYDYGWTDAVYEAGVEYTLNGDQALGLARARHGTAAGDFSRAASQQKILIGIKDRVLEKHFSITDLIGLASTLGDNLRTNFALPELKSAAHLTYDFDFNTMRQLALYPDYMTTGTIGGISYVLPSAGVGNYGAIRNFVATNLSNDPRDYEDPTILILNASDEVGLASAAQKELEEDGYKNVSADNAPEGEYEVETTLYALSDDKPKSKDLLETHFNTIVKSAADLPDNISRDYDFVVILNPKKSEE